MPMKPRDVYAALAAMVLVALGMGLIYLSVMERISVGATFALLAAAAVILPVTVNALRDTDE